MQLAILLLVIVEVAAKVPRSGCKARMSDEERNGGRESRRRGEASNIVCEYAGRIRSRVDVTKGQHTEKGTAGRLFLGSAGTAAVVKNKTKMTNSAQTHPITQKLRYLETEIDTNRHIGENALCAVDN